MPQSAEKNLIFAASLWAACAFMAAASSLAAQAAAPATQRAEFKIMNRPVDSVAPLLRPHLSASGEMHIQPQKRSVTVVDSRDKVAELERLVRQYDVPLRRVELVVKVIEASGEKPQEDVSEAIRGIGSRLKNVLRFSRYSLLDTAVLEGLEGNPMNVHLAQDFRVDCRLGYFLEDGRVIPVERFRFDKRQPSLKKGDEPSYQNLLTTALNMLDGEEIMLGASRAEPGADRALVLVMTARVKREP